MESQISDLPEYPALECCLIVEAHFATQKALMQALKASCLFDSIIPAQSITDALKIMSLQAFDATFIGAGLSVDKAKRFIVDSQEQSFAKDCAYIAMVPEGSEAFESFLEFGAHWVLELGYTKREFFDAVVKAVVKANANSPWKGILMSSLGANEASLEALFPTRRKDAKEEDIVALSSAKNRISAAEREALISKAVLQADNNMLEVFEMIKSNSQLSRASRSQLVAKKLREIIEALLSETKDLPENLRHKRIAEDILSDWVINLDYYSLEDATEKLRSMLKLFK